MSLGAIVKSMRLNDIQSVGVRALTALDRRQILGFRYIAPDGLQLRAEHFESIWVFSKSQLLLAERFHGFERLHLSLALHEPIFFLHHRDRTPRG